MEDVEVKMAGKTFQQNIRVTSQKRRRCGERKLSDERRLEEVAGLSRSLISKFVSTMMLPIFFLLKSNNTLTNASTRFTFKTKY